MDAAPNTKGSPRAPATNCAKRLSTNTRPEAVADEDRGRWTTVTAKRTVSMIVNRSTYKVVP